MADRPRRISANRDGQNEQQHTRKANNPSGNKNCFVGENRGRRLIFLRD